jgi:NADH-quinone oxidoreductase subunit M
LRLFIRAMHNRVGPKVDSRDISIRDGLVLVPLIAVILFLALYPQFALHRSEGSVKSAVFPAQAFAANPHTQLHYFAGTALAPTPSTSASVAQP